MSTLSYKPSGKTVDLANFKADDVDICDIITCLQNINRFGGAVRWSVAAHTMICVDLVQGTKENSLFSELRPVDEKLFRKYLTIYMLLHDAHEAYIGDIISPMAVLLGKDNVKAIKARFDLAIYKHFGVPLPNKFEQSIIDFVDSKALQLELHCLRNRQNIKQVALGNNWLTRMEFSLHNSSLDKEVEFTNLMIETFIEHKQEHTKYFHHTYCPAIWSDSRGEFY